MSAATIELGGAASADAGRDVRPGLGRLTRVELRKMTDTRAGFWLLLGTGALVALVVLITCLTGDPPDKTFRELFSNGVQAASFLLPILGILLATSEWSQRTGLVTFALVPDRLRVMTAKLLAGLVLAGVALVLCLLVAAIGTIVSAPDVPNQWTLPIGFFGQLVFYTAVGMITGVAFGAAFLASAPAIVASFLLPIAFGALGEINALDKTFDWLDTGRTLTDLADHLASATEWGRVGTSLALWMLLPLAIGFWRIVRSEIR